MDRRTAYYEGTSDILKKDGSLAARKASNVRNIVYELLESEVDSTIPMPRVDAIHEEDKELARGIEAILRSEVQMLRLVEMNDIQERTTTTQGGALRASRLGREQRIPLHNGRCGRDRPPPPAGNTAAGNL